MSGADAQTHGDHSQWAETSHCRVAGVRHFGAFAALELIAPRVARRAAARASSSWSPCPGGGFLLRRPLSLFAVARRPHRPAGRGARRRQRAARRSSTSATRVDVAGPLGSAFPTDGVTNALLVGGGIGCAPLQYLADELAAAGASVTAAFGFRDFRAARAAGAFSIDAALGRHRGRQRRAGRHGAPPARRARRRRPARPCYACGPTPMVAAVQRWTFAEGLRGYVSLEAHMACGTGSCHGCVVDTARGKLRVCSEGPVFALDEVTP